MRHHQKNCFIASLVCGVAAALISCSSLVAEESKTTATPWKNPLVKQGYVGSPLVEVTPFVFQNKLYRLDNYQAFFSDAGEKPGARFLEDEVQIRDVETGRLVSVALTGHAFASALVHEGVVYVFAGKHDPDRPWRQITEISMTSSKDLKTWSPPQTILKSEGAEVLFNAAVCYDGKRFVLLYETNDSRWPAFTFKYSTNPDIRDAAGWTTIPDAIYGRKKYVGGPALYFEGGWYYTLYLESLHGKGWETRITRSRDLLRWQDATNDRPFVTFDPQKKNLPRRPAQIGENNASDAELCYFGGKTIVYFTGSDQQVAGDLQWATYDGTPQQLLESFFDNAAGMDTQKPEHAGDWYPVLVNNQTVKPTEPVGALKKYRPTARQLRYQTDQMGAFVHYGPSSYNGGDMMTVSPAEIFNPDDLDTEQWVLAAKSFGAKHVILTAKHHNGFCLWPTKTTDYSVKSSPWKNGQGDVVRELEVACRKHGLKMGLYLSAGDFHFGCSSTPDPLGKRKLRGDRNAYFEFYMAQLKELLTEYGDITAVWIDGAYDPFGWDVADPTTGKRIGNEHAKSILEMVREYQPNAVMFGANLPDVRWSGSEQGWSPYPLWNVVKHGDGPPNWISPDARGWYIVEANVHTRSTWFWTPNSDSTLKTPEQLMTVYNESIGRGGNILINMTPDTSGQIPAAEVKILKTFGENLKARFSAEAGRTNSRKAWTKPGVLELSVNTSRPVDQVAIEEDIVDGQQILSYEIDVRVDEKWKTVAKGLSVGRRRVEQFEPVSTDRIRLRITRAASHPTIAVFAAYHTSAKR